MIVFDSLQWSDKELRRMGDLAVAIRRNLKCEGKECPCEYQHLCNLMRDVQIMCKKELDKRMKGDGRFDDN